MGALIKALITIVNTVMFFIRNASRLPWRSNSVVSLLSDDTDLDGHARNETERAGRVEPLLTPQSRSQIRVMPKDSESACEGFYSRRLRDRCSKRTGPTIIKNVLDHRPGLR